MSNMQFSKVQISGKKCVHSGILKAQVHKPIRIYIQNAQTPLWRGKLFAPQTLIYKCLNEK